MRHSILLISLLLILASFSPVHAHYLYPDTTGEQEAAEGEQVGIGVYLHVTEDDGLSFYSLYMGFDDSALDGSGLAYVSTDYGDDGMIPLINSEYMAGASSKYPGESLLKYISRDTAPGGPTLPIYEGDNLLLFTAYFTFTGGDVDGEDLWIEWDAPESSMSAFAFDNGYYTSLDVYTDEAGTELLGDNGPDFKSSAVPIPGAVWLLGSGLAGIAAVCRKNRYPG